MCSSDLLTKTDSENKVTTFYDPYSFSPQLEHFDLHLFSEGKHLHIYKLLGAHSKTVDGIDGVLFATWAPNAMRVSVIGDFNTWDGRRHHMRSRDGSGVWELFIPGLKHGMLYKFEICNRDTEAVFTKTDPYAQQFELRPKTASVICEKNTFKWHDHHWIKNREKIGRAHV